MIVDVHTHYWAYPDDFTDDFRRQAARVRGAREVDLTVSYDYYRANATDDTM